MVGFSFIILVLARVEHELRVDPAGELCRFEWIFQIASQYILALIVEAALSEIDANKKIVVTNDATSNLITEIAKKHGASIVEVETGEINVVDKMEELNSPVGGEGSSSGGIVPPSKCRDGVLSLVQILHLMAKRK